MSSCWRRRNGSAGGETEGRGAGIQLSPYAGRILVELGLQGLLARHGAVTPESVTILSTPGRRRDRTGCRSARPPSSAPAPL